MRFITLNFVALIFYLTDHVLTGNENAKDTIRSMHYPIPYPLEKANRFKQNTNAIAPRRFASFQQHKPNITIYERILEHFTTKWNDTTTEKWKDINNTDDGSMCFVSYPSEGLVRSSRIGDKHELDALKWNMENRIARLDFQKVTRIKFEPFIDLVESVVLKLPRMEIRNKFEVHGGTEYILDVNLGSTEDDIF
jgi:hypothetical protein